VSADDAKNVIEKGWNHVDIQGSISLYLILLK
jgi:hypothetical protein